MMRFAMVDRHSSRERSAQRGALLALLSLTALAGIAAWLATADWPEFYARLSRPAWAPQTNLMISLWAVPYLLAATATWLGVREWGWKVSHGLVSLYLLQLFVSALWQILLFGRHFGAAALVVGTLLVILAAASSAALFRLHRRAAMLMSPYVLWVTFTLVLTFSVWRRNPFLL